MNPSTSKKLSLLLSLLVFATGAVVLAGWLLHIPILMTWGPGLDAMKFNTAIAFMIAAISMALLQREQGNFFYVVGKILAAIVAIIGLATPGEFIFVTTFVIVNLLT